MSNMVERAGMVELVRALPLIQERYAARQLSRKAHNGHDTLLGLREHMDDLQYLSRSLCIIECKNALALQVFASMLDFINCTLDAFKVRLLIKKKFPQCDVDVTAPSEDFEASLTTIGAWVHVEHHNRKSTVPRLLHGTYVPTPKRVIDSYRMNSAGKLHILATNIRTSMIFLYFCSDTLSRKWVDPDPAQWDMSIVTRLGVCYGGVLVVEAPIDTGEQVEAAVFEWTSYLTEIIDAKLRKQAVMVPGRSLIIIHERNANRFRERHGKDAHIVLKEKDHVLFEKDSITGVYCLDCFDM